MRPVRLHSSVVATPLRGVFGWALEFQVSRETAQPGRGYN